ncbi:MAG: alpha/beta hydrolase [Vicinamibacterales bacterium]
MVIVGLWSFVGAGQDRATPYVDGRDVTFVASGDPSDPPRVAADFNGWDPSAGVMTRRGTGLYELRLRLHPAARIEYLIAYRNRFEVDPRNPLSVPSPTGAPRSELRMPGYQPPAALPRPAVPGLVQNVPFTSKGGESRRVRVHRPRDAAGLLPVLYIHDGIIAAEELGMPAIIDALVDSQQMAPITAVFINSIDRYEDYAVGSMFGYVFAGEIVPAIEGRYRVAAGSRAILGFSRSAVGALDVAFNGRVAFARCGLVAPALSEQVIASILGGSTRSRPRVTIAAGSYDVPLVDDARALRKALEARGVPLDWIETPEGHNHTAWKAHLRRLLTSWFPPTGVRTGSDRGQSRSMT